MWRRPSIGLWRKLHLLLGILLGDGRCSTGRSSHDPLRWWRRPLIRHGKALELIGWGKVRSRTSLIAVSDCHSRLPLLGQAFRDEFRVCRPTLGVFVACLLAHLAHMAWCFVCRQVVSFVRGCRWTSSHVWVVACKVPRLQALVVESHVRSTVIGTPDWKTLLGC